MYVHISTQSTLSNYEDLLDMRGKDRSKDDNSYMYIVVKDRADINVDDCIILVLKTYINLPYLYHIN